MRNKARHEDKVEWPITYHLVGDVDVGALRIVRFRGSHGLVNHPGHPIESPHWVEPNDAGRLTCSYTARETYSPFRLRDGWLDMESECESGAWWATQDSNQ